MPAPAENAVTIFGQGFNCSQAVFSAFSTQFGLAGQTALKLASPFGGGLARRGETCGAVTGALLVLGLARGADTPAGKEAIYQLAQDYMRRFEAKHGSCLCRELIGCDISTPEGWQIARETGKTREICPGLVRDAAEIIQTLLDTTPPNMT
jgi:C_GCAxxG_C_C family probable redox protein